MRPARRSRALGKFTLIPCGRGRIIHFLKVGTSQKSLTQQQSKTMQFTEPQRQAIQTKSVRVAVAAGPGSGKTKVLVERIKAMIAAGIPAKSICVITFTNNAAREIERRL